MKRSRYFLDYPHFNDATGTTLFPLSSLQCPHCGVVRYFTPLLAKVTMIGMALGCQIKILSAYRCAEYNATLPDAVPNSAHLYGLALDVRPVGDALEAVAYHAKRLGIPRIKLYPPTPGKREGWVHLGYNEVPKEYRK